MDCYNRNLLSLNDYFVKISKTIGKRSHSMLTWVVVIRRPDICAFLWWYAVKFMCSNPMLKRYQSYDI